VPVLTRVARRDTAAMRECLARYGGLVWSLARRHTRSAQEAEDAAQEVFLDVWKSAGRYDASIASETAFIAMIARRRLIDIRRKHRNEGHGPTDAGPEPVDERAAPDRCAEASLAAEALEKIRPEQRTVLILACEGYSHDDISRETGMPLGTVKAHARRGLLQLRALLLGVEDLEVPS
jgi:RNA polymerase sigma-70 factor (ECF subfamily)